MLERGKNERGVIEMVDMESLVPQEHLLRKVDTAVDFEKVYEIVAPLYSEDEGRRSIDPVVLFKLVLLQHLDGNGSLRGTLRRAQTDVAYRWFLRYTLSEELPHFSKETIERVFADAKEKHGMRYTHYRGLAQISNWVSAAMNLKKLASWKARRIVPTPHFPLLPQFLFHILRPVWQGARRAVFRQAGAAVQGPPPFIQDTRSPTIRFASSYRPSRSSRSIISHFWPFPSAVS